MTKNEPVVPVVSSEGPARRLHLSTLFIGKEKQYLIENLGMLIASGMGVVAAFEALEADMRSPGMRKLMAHMKESIEAGIPLWRALEETGLFAGHIVSLIRVGEETGRFTENLRLIADHEQKEAMFRSKIRSALMYPLFVLGLTAVIGVGIAWFILPRLTSVFTQLNVKLPLITRILIAVGNILSTYGSIVIPLVFIAILALIYFLFFFPKTKWVGQTILFHLPVISQLIREVELSRFGYLLGTLLDAGVPVVDALNSLEHAATFRQYKKLYTHLREGVAEGNSLQKNFASFGKTIRLIPRPIQQLVVVGEQAGNLSATLLKIGEMYEHKTETTTKNLTVVLEPILLVVVWLAVVFVALAVILPIYSLIGGIQH